MSRTSPAVCVFVLSVSFPANSIERTSAQLPQKADPIPYFSFPQPTGKRNDDEGAKEKLYTYAMPVLGLGTAKGLQTTVIDQE